MTFPVVSAGSDHRLLSGNPSGCVRQRLLQQSQMEYEVVVIGAGIGGLTAAAVLAKRGLNVCLLERQSFAGGCAALVEHAGYQFEPTHGLYCGWQPEGVFERLFRELSFPSPAARKLSIPYLVRLPGGVDVPRIG